VTLSLRVITRVGSAKVARATGGDAMGKVIILCLALAGCTTTAPTSNPRQTWCDLNTARRPSKAVVMAMSRSELDDLNSYNAKGANWCGWKP
jgi:hypothetical protein